MKKFTQITFLIGLFSLAAFAQTKSKPKTDAKPANVKAAAKTAIAKPIDKKASGAKSKTAPGEKASSEKSKTAKTQPPKTQNPKDKAAKEKAKKEETAKEKKTKEKNAKTQNAKSLPVKNSPVKAPTEKTNAAKTESVKTQSKSQPVKSQPTTAKVADKTVAKPVTKSNVKPPIKVSSPENVKPKIESAAKPVVETFAEADPNFDAGEIVGKTYANKTLNFSLALPDDWEIADEDFARRLKDEGINLSVETPKAAKASAQNKLNAAVNRVRILLTAFKASTETNKNAILRVSVEDLRYVPQVKDAVDYFDSMRATYQNIKLPANFKYSETQAEKLGAMQFGFLDVSQGAGKKRMYATVRGGYAVMFTLTYQSEEDLAALKKVLADGDFRRR